jgi:hypothetical protein
MRTLLLAVLLSFGVGGLVGCDDAKPKGQQSGNDNSAPPPQDSGAGAGPKQPRIPKKI